MDREVLHIGVRESGTTRVLSLTGELDSYTCEQLQCISDTWTSGARRLIVNLDRLAYIDSSGLAALVGLWVKAQENGVEMVLACRNRRVNRIMEITGLSKLFGLDEARVQTPAIPKPAYDPAGLLATTQMVAAKQGAYADRASHPSAARTPGTAQRKAA